MQTISQYLLPDGARAVPCDMNGVTLGNPSSVVVGLRCALHVRFIDDTGHAVALSGAAERTSRFVIGQDFDSATVPLFATSAVVWDEDEAGFTVDLTGTRTAEMLAHLGTSERASLVCEIACYSASDDTETARTPAYVVQWPIVVLNRVDSFADPAPAPDSGRFDHITLGDHPTIEEAIGALRSILAVLKGE